MKLKKGLKELTMKAKIESEKSGLMLNIMNTKSVVNLHTKRTHK